MTRGHKKSPSESIEVHSNLRIRCASRPRADFFTFSHVGRAHCVLCGSSRQTARDAIRVELKFGGVPPFLQYLILNRIIAYFAFNQSYRLFFGVVADCESVATRVIRDCRCIFFRRLCDVPEPGAFGEEHIRLDRIYGIGRNYDF